VEERPHYLIPGPCHSTGGEWLAFLSGGPGLFPGQSICDLWWRNRHWDRFCLSPSTAWFMFNVGIMENCTNVQHGKIRELTVGSVRN
jgi:hypothetical protein